MVGKPNLTLKTRNNALDQEREHSMADEGGAAGALYEAEPAAESVMRGAALDRARAWIPTLPALSGRVVTTTIGFGVGIAIGAAAGVWWLGRRKSSADAGRAAGLLAVEVESDCFKA